jgi:hypothetical protein
MTRIKEIVRGIEILKKYNPNFENDWLGAEHDQIFFPLIDPKIISEEDLKELDELGYTVDEDEIFIFTFRLHS